MNKIKTEDVKCFGSDLDFFDATKWSIYDGEGIDYADLSAKDTNENIVEDGVYDIMLTISHEKQIRVKDAVEVKGGKFADTEFLTMVACAHRLHIIHETKPISNHNAIEKKEVIDYVKEHGSCNVFLESCEFCDGHQAFIISTGS